MRGDFLHGGEGKEEKFFTRESDGFDVVDHFAADISSKRLVFKFFSERFGFGTFKIFGRSDKGVGDD